MTTRKKSMSPFAKELIQSMKEGLAHLKGEGPAIVTKISLPEPQSAHSRIAKRPPGKPQ